jgi:hypothetical protein
MNLLNLNILFIVIYFILLFLYSFLKHDYFFFLTAISIFFLLQLSQHILHRSTILFILYLLSYLLWINSIHWILSNLYFTIFLLVFSWNITILFWLLLNAVISFNNLILLNHALLKYVIRLLHSLIKVYFPLIIFVLCFKAHFFFTLMKWTFINLFLVLCKRVDY